jgi:hypothetical protein
MRVVEVVAHLLSEVMVYLIHLAQVQLLVMAVLVRHHLSQVHP